MGTSTNSEESDEMLHNAAFKVGNRPVNMHIGQTSGQYWF